MSPKRKGYEMITKKGLTFLDILSMTDWYLYESPPKPVRSKAELIASSEYS